MGIFRSDLSRVLAERPSTRAVAGPLAGSAGMIAAGPPGLFGTIAVMALAGALFGIWRTRISAPVPGEEQQPFRGLPRTTPMVAVLEEEEAAGSSAART